MFVRVSVFVSLVITTLTLNLTAAEFGPFFDYNNKTDKKVELLRNEFFIDEKDISDEELKEFYRKNQKVADGLLYKLDIGKQLYCNSVSSCPNGRIPTRAVKKYAKSILSSPMQEFNQLILNLYASTLGSFAFQIFAQLNSPIGTIKQGIRAYELGAEAVTGFNESNFYFYVYSNGGYEDVRDRGEDPFQSSNLDEIYDEAYSLIIESTQTSWNHDLIKGSQEYEELKKAIYNLLECAYIYSDDGQSRQWSIRRHIGKYILDYCIKTEILQPLYLTIENSDVEQNNSVKVSGHDFGKNSTVYYDIINVENETQKRFETKASKQGIIQFDIPTNCETKIGKYLLIITDKKRSKSTQAPFTVLPALACDDVPPSLTEVSPADGTEDVPINLQDICFMFSEPMGHDYNITWNNLQTDEQIEFSGWEFNNRACFRITEELPSFHTISWTLNKEVTDHDFTDIAGNKLSTISGSFSTVDANQFIDIPMELDSWNAFEVGYGNINSAPSGSFSSTDDGLFARSTFSRSGIHIYHKNALSFLNKKLYIKWKAGDDSKSFMQMAVGIGWMDDNGYNDGISQLFDFPNRYRYDVFEYNKWYYTQISVSSDGSYTAVTSINAYADEGGQLFSTTQRDIPIWNEILSAEKTTVYIRSGDCWGGSNAWFVLGESRVGPVSEP